MDFRKRHGRHALLFNIFYLQEGKKMLEKMDMMLVTAKMRWDAFVERMLHEEKGATDIVAIMVIIVIVLAVAAIFREKLIEMVNAVFNKTITWVNEN